MAMSGDEEVKKYVISGLPKKSDVEEIASTIKLKVPKETCHNPIFDHFIFFIIIIILFTEKDKKKWW